MYTQYMLSHGVSPIFGVGVIFARKGGQITISPVSYSRPCRERLLSDISFCTIA